MITCDKYNDVGSFNYIMTKMSIFACSLLNAINDH